MPPADGEADGLPVPGTGTVAEPDGEGVADRPGRGDRDGRGVALGLAGGVGVPVFADGDHVGVTGGTGPAGAVGRECPCPDDPDVPESADPDVPGVGPGRTVTHSASTARNSAVSTTVEVRGRPAANRRGGRP